MRDPSLNRDLAVTIRGAASLVIALLMAAVVSAVAFAGPGDVEPQEVDDKIADGIAALTKQDNAVNLTDMIRALHLDLSWYKRSEHPGSTFNVDYWRRESADLRKKSPILYFTFTTVQVHFPIPSIPGPPLRPSQSIKILLERGRCISVKALAERIHAKFRAYHPAIMASTNRAAGAVATSTSESRDEAHLSYFARIDGTPGASKTEAVENGLDLDDECSQQVGISKTFDYDYWNSLCPFEYNAHLVDSAVVPAMKEKYGASYTEFALQQPDLKDYGSFIALRFYKSTAGPNQVDEFAMEVDRCTAKVTRTWEVPASALRDSSRQ